MLTRPLKKSEPQFKFNIMVTPTKTGLVTCIPYSRLTKVSITKTHTAKFGVGGVLQNITNKKKVRVPPYVFH